MMLELRNLKNNFKLIIKGRNEVYFDDINNNIIIFKPYDKELNTSSICNGISDEPYAYLIDELNNNKNLVVFWCQIEGTTSDYIIYHGLNTSELIKCKNYSSIIKAIPNNELQTCKYIEYKDNKFTPCNIVRK